ncbi:hypothetical protein T484DRAFT_1770294 [Baffinella frigidus]|nr:hypothetical protein T484DRAFT_1770294 [Cryptophyta sp. CCMP2293]
MTFEVKGVVNGVAFNPAASDELTSVGEDGAVRFWDARSGSKPVGVCNVGFGELYCVDWNAEDSNLVAIGSHSGHPILIFDRRTILIFDTITSGEILIFDRTTIFQAIT